MSSMKHMKRESATDPENLAARIRRQVKRKRNDDSLRAERSLSEKQQRAELKLLIKQSKQQKPAPDGEKPNKVKKLTSLARKAAVSQAKTLSGLNPEKDIVVASTPTSVKIVSMEMDASPIPPDGAAGTMDVKNLLSEDNYSSDDSEDETQGAKKNDPKITPTDGGNDDVQEGEDEEVKSQEGEGGVGGEKDSSDDVSSSTTTSSDDEEAEEDLSKPRKLSKEEMLAQLLHQEGDSEVVELSKGSGIFVDEDAYETLLSRSKLAHTTIARNLLDLVFTTDAMCNCSLFGKAQKGPLGRTERPRPGLYPHAVAVIEKTARQICKDKSIKKVDPTTVHRQMGTRLSEVRGCRKRAEEFKAMRQKKKLLKRATKKASKSE